MRRIKGALNRWLQAQPMPWLIIVALCGAMACSGMIPAPWEQADVTRVIDGDTIEVRISGTLHRVRLKGIDTPEIYGEDPECYGLEATARMEELLAGGKVLLVRGKGDDLDHYGRLLRWIFLVDQPGAKPYKHSALIQLELVYGGYARVDIHDDDTHERSLAGGWRLAKDLGRGLHSACR